MSGRIRTSKKLAQRIDRGYLQRLSPLLRWQRILTIGIGMLIVAWLGVHAFSGNQTPYSSGPLSAPHAMLGSKCAQCHSGAQVSDNACRSCHFVSVHQVQQVSAPGCGSCHLEHKGTAALVDVSERSCTSCHSNLRVKHGAVAVAANIRSFQDGHPQFSAIRLGLRNPTTITFSHVAHMRRDLPVFDKRVDLSCSDCHRVNDRTKFGQMAPVSYAEHCANCHPLNFDSRFTEQVPHRNPAIVDNFIRGKFQDYIASQPTNLRIPERAAEPRAAYAAVPLVSGPGAWVQLHTAEAEQLLWKKTCKECHLLQPTGGSFPNVAPSNLVLRWNQKARFSHNAHEYLRCVGCHAAAVTSTTQADLLLPGIETCQRCHITGNQSAAPADCSTCHVYHNPALPRGGEGMRSIERVSAVR